MLFSYNWLQEYFDKPLPKANDLASILNTKAFEIEEIKEINDDYVIDIDVQPNRAHDCFSHYGIAKEIKVLTKLPVKKHKFTEIKEDFKSNLNVKINSNKCYRYIGVEVKNIEIKESPQEIKNKLEVLGQRSINNIVDFTNLVAFELGQPMHAFDKDKLDGNTIHVRNANKGEDLTTLDGKYIIFEGDEMIIADDKEALAVAGIKGGGKAEVDMNTKSIVFEAANFDASTIKKTVQKIDVETDSSKRFEKGISPELAEISIKRILELVKKYASSDKTEFGNIIDIYPRPIGIYKTGVSLQEINKKLGKELQKKEVEEVFDRLDFEYEKVITNKKIVEYARKLEGKPYKYASSVLYDAPNFFDCSSFTSYLYKEAGISIPRMVVDQYVYGDEISAEDLIPGDLIFSNTKELKRKIDYKSIEFLPGTEVPEGVDHVGIYLGDGEVIHATEENNNGVIIEKINNATRFGNVVGHRRLFSPDEERFVITVPNERLDIRIKEDVIEEIGRVYGYENIEEKLINSDLKANQNIEYDYLNSLRVKLVNLGFSEIMTYTFVDVDNGELETTKYIASDKGFLRSTIIPNMQKALDLNEKNKDLLGLDRIKIFEIGHVFSKDSEKIMLCIGVSGKKSDSIVNEVLTEIGLEGKANNGIVEIELKINEIKEIETIKLPETEISKYKPFSQYPFILRDIAVWVPKENSEEDVLNTIKEQSGELLMTTKLFDRYEKDDRVSYAFRLVFQSQEKTLTDEEINVIMDKVTKTLNGREGFEVR